MNEELFQIINECERKLGEELGISVHVYYKQRANAKLDPKECITAIKNHLPANILWSDIISFNRKPDYTEYRHITAWILHKQAGLTQLETGKYIDRHHCTVLNSCYKFEALYKYDKAFRLRAEPILLELNIKF